jgi:hypothetical protein
VAADAGTVVQMNSASATTITVNTALFAAGDTVQIQNVGAGVCTVTAGTATVSTSAVLALKQYDAGSLYFNSTSAALFFAADAADNTSPLTTKGDLYTFSTTNDRLPVGTNNQTLVADSAEATGLKWATPAVASSGLVLISRTTFSSVASQAFDNVFTSTYKAYKVVIENISGATGTDDLQMQFRYAGPTTQTTNYFGPRFYQVYTSTVTAANINGATEQTLINQIGSSAEPTTGSLDFYQVGNSSARPYAYAQMQCAFEGVLDFSYAWNSTGRIYTGFLLKSSSSNVSGTVAIYGLATV